MSNIHEARFSAMGTDVHLLVHGDSAGRLDHAVDRIDELEARWSRFRPDSEVSRINAAAGHPVAVSDDTRLLVRRAVEAWRRCGGGFDPLVLGDVEEAGYDRTFTDLDSPLTAGDADDHRFAPRSRGRVARAALAATPRLAGPDDIVIGPETVQVPFGTGFDPGGIGKGLAADVIAGELRDLGARGACVNIGGDLRVLGLGPTDGGWTVTIDHPNRPAPLATVVLHDGAVATSTTLKRRWTHDGLPRHHLIDPVTRAPSTSDLELVTVVARRGWIAEALATATILRSAATAFDVVDGTGAEALAVTRGGALLRSADFDAFEHPIGVAS